VTAPVNIDPAFAAYERQLARVSDYIGAITPALADNRGAVPVFVESMMVVMVARFEHFFNIVDSRRRSSTRVGRAPLLQPAWES
jgi:hypothetical protein